jgi:hypothetical protein
MSAPLEVLAAGWVSQRQPGPTAVAAGPRVIRRPDGELWCGFMVQSKLAINDFVPVLARSRDHGATWTRETVLWPHLAGRYSLFVTLSQSPAGEAFLYGSRYVIDTPGESFWSDATQGLKANELCWARYDAAIGAWPEPQVIPMAIPGAAEAAGPLCVTRGGRWVGCYAPYNTFDPAVKVDRAQVALVASENRGASWSYTPMLRFAEADSSAAECWVVQLADGRLLGTSWHLRPSDGSDFPNAYAISRDEGRSWSATRATGTLGHTTALTPLPEGDVLFVYVQRKHGPPGIRLCRARPDEADFGARWDELLWAAPAAAQPGGAGDHTDWANFAYGEPMVAAAGDGTWLLVFWCIHSTGSGIRYVRFRLR